MAADLMGGAVQIRHVRKSYGDVRVLDGVSIDVAPGEAVVICGPSGCGKSTLLRCINGLEPIQGGDILVGGVKVDRDKPDILKQVRQKTGLVFQNFNLFPHMTTLDNIIIAPMKVTGVEKQQATEEAMALLASVGIPEKALVYPYQLSGGQRQRVAIARAIAGRPSLIVLDEALSAVDASIRIDLLELLLDIQRADTVAYLFIAHDLGMIRAIAHRTAILDAGRIAEIGPTQSIIAAPQTQIGQQLVAAAPRLFHVADQP